MEEALYSSTDFILMPIYLLVFFFIAQNIQRKNIASNPLYKYYVRGLFAKFAGGFIACMIYLFYYGGGDTIGYFVSGKLVYANRNVGVLQNVNSIQTQCSFPFFNCR